MKIIDLKKKIQNKTPEISGNIIKKIYNNNLNYAGLN